jgi:hypothetical protein
MTTGGLGRTYFENVKLVGIVAANKTVALVAFGNGIDIIEQHDQSSGHRS